MPNTKPLTTTQAALDDKLQRAAAKCLVNYGFFVGATAENLPDLLQANPTPGIKIFMGSMHGALLVDQAEALERIFAKGHRLIAVHAEDQDRIRQRREQFAEQLAGSPDPVDSIPKSRTIKRLCWQRSTPSVSLRNISADCIFSICPPQKKPNSCGKINPVGSPQKSPRNICCSTSALTRRSAPWHK